MRRIILLLTVALVMAAMVVGMAMPAMAFNSSHHCNETQNPGAPDPDNPCPVPTDGPPALSGGPGQSHLEGTKGNDNVQPNPSSLAVHCDRIGGSGTTVQHFDKDGPTKTTGGGDCV